MPSSWLRRAKGGGARPTANRPSGRCLTRGSTRSGWSGWPTIMPHWTLSETAVVRDPYARWCERGAPRGVPLLDSLAAACIVVDADLRRHDDKVDRAHYQTIRLILGVALATNLSRCARQVISRGRTPPQCAGAAP